MRARPRTVATAPLAALALAALLCGGACTRTVVVTVPPRVDLTAYPIVGVVGFAAEGDISPGDDVTHRFLATLQAAQPGVRLLELGPEHEVLRAVGLPTLDFDAVRAAGKRFGVDALLTGRLTVSPVRPNLSVSPDLTSLSARASVNGSLQAKLRETGAGATVWTNGAHGTWTLATLGLNAQGLPTGAGLADADRQREKMLADLVRVATADFRATYEKRRVEE